MNQVGFGVIWEQKHLTDLHFSNDIALIAGEDEVMHQMTTKLKELAVKDELCITSNKSKVIRVGRYQNTQPITVTQKSLEKVSHFPYLGSCLSENEDAKIDVNARLGKVAPVFQRLQWV